MSTPATSTVLPAEGTIQWPIARSDYEIGNSIGEGATAIVYEAVCLPLRRKCAVKIISLDRSNTSASLDEINVGFRVILIIRFRGKSNP